MALYIATKTFGLSQNYRTQIRGLPNSQIKKRSPLVPLCFSEECAIKLAYSVLFPYPSSFSLQVTLRVVVLIINCLHPSFFLLLVVLGLFVLAFLFFIINLLNFPLDFDLSSI
jgi:hypothetical protein